MSNLMWTAIDYSINMMKNEDLIDWPCFVLNTEGIQAETM